MGLFSPGCRGLRLVVAEALEYAGLAGQVLEV